MTLSIRGLKRKLLLLALLPFIGATAAIAIAVALHARSLSNSQQHIVATAYQASKQAELRNYLDLARSAIAPLYDSGRDDDETRARALQVLSKLEFGTDGYFFVYDRSGKTLMHSRQPELVGRNLWDMQAPDGTPTIQLLIHQAEHGGGFVQYPWGRPSTHQMEPKLGYVVLLDRWGWVVGTGIYLDDVNAALAQIDQHASSNIKRTLLWIGLIGTLGMLVIGACGLALNITDHRSSDAKLKLLALQVVESQEAERGRLSRELHDGISQMLVSTKLLLESVPARLEMTTPQQYAIAAPINKALGQINRTLGEIRRISHDLRPAMLDDFGLAAALVQLGREFGESGPMPAAGVSIDTSAAAGKDLPEAINTVLFRIAQEALTNIACHAQARCVKVTLAVLPQQVTLSIVDDGRGFDYDAVQADARRGIGLRNMRERAESLGGRIQIDSQPGRTALLAVIPFFAVPFPTSEHLI
jgi:two-component system NarL family sensor kinase